jgi:hypothetical protein
MVPIECPKTCPSSFQYLQQSLPENELFRFPTESESLQLVAKAPKEFQEVSKSGSPLTPRKGCMREQGPRTLMSRTTTDLKFTRVHLKYLTTYHFGIKVGGYM